MGGLKSISFASIMALSLRCFCGLVFILAAEGEYVLRGENNQAVEGCACIGKKDKHGYCGYHKNLFSKGDKPWCRTKYRCGHQSMLGAWDNCDDRSVERRFHEGQWLTSRDFYERYGGSG